MALFVNPKKVREEQERLGRMNKIVLKLSSPELQEINKEAKREMGILNETLKNAKLTQEQKMMMTKLTLDHILMRRIDGYARADIPTNALKRLAKKTTETARKYVENSPSSRNNLEWIKQATAPPKPKPVPTNLDWTKNFPNRTILPKAKKSA